MDALAAGDYARLSHVLEARVKESESAETDEFVQTSLVSLVAMFVKPDTPPSESQARDVLESLILCAELAVGKLKALAARDASAREASEKGTPVAPA
eukprot:1476792-Prymnesium_polylepis.1